MAKKKRGHSGERRPSSPPNLQALPGHGTIGLPGLRALPGANHPVAVNPAFLARQAQQLLAEEMKAAVQEVLQREAELEYKFSLNDSWSVQLFTAVARKYGVKPYRTHGQKSQTVMIRATKSLVDEKLWPEFQQLSDRLHVALEKTTHDLIVKALGLVCPNCSHTQAD